MLTNDELRRIRDHAAANPSHAGDVVLRLVAEVERLKLERASPEESEWGRARDRKVIEEVEAWTELMRQKVATKQGRRDTP